MKNYFRDINKYYIDDVLVTLEIIKTVKFKDKLYDRIFIINVEYGIDCMRSIVFDANNIVSKVDELIEQIKKRSINNEKNKSI